jgi:hypothetical protein
MDAQEDALSGVVSLPARDGREQNRAESYEAEPSRNSVIPQEPGTRRTVHRSARA